LDLADLLCPGVDQALFDRLKRGSGFDGERVVVDRTPPALPSPITDDLSTVTRSPGSISKTGLE
jgi:hypothetical protein